MLKRIQFIENEAPKNQKNRQIRIADAGFPGVFPHTLEFNPPAHGTWNIVHIGMNLPEAHQIYICAINCMRGVILTAAEMNASDRFSFVILKEEDMVEGTVEDITIEGISDVIRRLPKRPQAVIVFPVCTHHFLGCNMRRIYAELEAEFQDIDFIRAWMDPIMQKEGPTPDQKLREHMYDVVPELPVEDGKIAIIGGNINLSETSDVYKVAALYGISVKQMPECQNYAEYQQLGTSSAFLGFVPNSQRALNRIGKRLGRTVKYLPMTFDYEENEAQLMELADLFARMNSQAAIQREDSCRDQKENKDFAGDTGKQSQEVNEQAKEQKLKTVKTVKTVVNTTLLYEYIEEKKQQIEEKVARLHARITDAEITIDYTAHPRPLGLAAFLLQHGFHVTAVYLNAINPEEEKAYRWLQEHAPDLLLIGTIQPECRTRSRRSTKKTLAIGQQAAWFTGTEYFVNIVEGKDYQGFDGISRMLDAMAEAWSNAKDPEDLIPRKGLGCESCV